MKMHLLIGALLLASCSTLMGLQKLDAMDDEEFGRYVARATAQVSAIASVAVAEGDLDAGELHAIAESLRGLAAGTVGAAAGQLGQALQIDSYAAAGLAITVSELDARLEERGAYLPGGALSERARGVLVAVAASLEALIPPG